MLVINGNKTINLEQYGILDVVSSGGYTHVTARSAHSNFCQTLYKSESEVGAQNIYDMILDAWKAGKSYIELT